MLKQPEGASIPAQLGDMPMHMKGIPKYKSKCCWRRSRKYLPSWASNMRHTNPLGFTCLWSYTINYSLRDHRQNTQERHESSFNHSKDMQRTCQDDLLLGDVWRISPWGGIFLWKGHQEQPMEKKVIIIQVSLIWSGYRGMLCLNQG